MVLEYIYKVSWIRKKPVFCILLGLFYALLGLVFAITLFPDDPALVAVAFASIMILPSLYKLFKVEEKEERKARKFSLRKLFIFNKDAVKIYLYLSLGIFLIFSFFAIMLPSLATGHLFREQLEIIQGSTGQAIAAPTGGAIFSSGLFLTLFGNNIMVLMFCFIISLLAGNGAIFLITWNLSVWGTIFGNLSKTAAGMAGKNPFVYFIIIMFTVLPHAFLELLGYIIASISGGVISRTFLLEKAFSKKFKDILLYNIILLFIGIVIMAVGALVETYVLYNVDIYRVIINQAFGFM